MTTCQETLTIAGISANVIRRKVKHARISVTAPNGELNLIVPHAMSETTIHEAMTKTMRWIKKAQKKMRECQREPEKHFVTGELHYFFGEAYPLTVSESNGKAHVEFDAKTGIQLFVKPNSSREERLNALNAWYRNALTQQLKTLISEWEKRLSVNVATVCIRRMKSRWGSCMASKRKLTFNLELAKKPLDCVEYVVVHELTHFFADDHGQYFQRRMFDALPNWKELREKLNKLPSSHELF